MADRRVVKRRTREKIRRIASEARRSLGLKPSDRVAMRPLLEQALYDVIPGYDFEVIENHRMGRLEAVTDLNKPHIKMRESVYHALRRSDGRARMTAAHEFGHLLMHTGMPVFAAFGKYDPTTDVEWQADTFAAEFIMPEEVFRKCTSPIQAMRRFGVSRDAALCRARKLRHFWKQKEKKKERKLMARAP